MIYKGPFDCIGITPNEVYYLRYNPFVHCYQRYKGLEHGLQCYNRLYGWLQPHLNN
jgi:hypothetical protein